MRPTILYLLIFWTCQVFTQAAYPVFQDPAGRFSLSESSLYFDSSFIRVVSPGQSHFKIGKVCQTIGCIGDWERTGAVQVSWVWLEDKIILSYASYLPPDAWQTCRTSVEIMIWKYNPKLRKFGLVKPSPFKIKK